MYRAGVSDAERLIFQWLLRDYKKVRSRRIGGGSGLFLRFNNYEEHLLKMGIGRRQP